MSNFQKYVTKWKREKQGEQGNAAVSTMEKIWKEYKGNQKTLRAPWSHFL